MYNATSVSSIGIEVKNVLPQTATLTRVSNREISRWNINICIAHAENSALAFFAAISLSDECETISARATAIKYRLYRTEFFSACYTL